MGFVSDIFGGGSAADASEYAARLQAETAREGLQFIKQGAAQGQNYLSPYAQAGQAGLNNLSILTDPQAQYDYLQSNPLYQASLANANQQSSQLAAARGTLSSGGFQQELANNVLLSAQPYLTQQQQNVQNLLGYGGNIAQAQANTAIGAGSQIANQLGQIGAAQASGVVGAANAQQQGMQNLLTTGLTVAGMFSDERLKKNIEKIGERNGFNWYHWEWNDLAYSKFGLSGEMTGVIAQEVKETNPELVKHVDGFLTVDYEGIENG